MAGPIATIRQTPSGISLDDGQFTKITFARFPAVSFWEKAVQPPGADSGEPIDTSTQHNVRFRTMAPRSLITQTPAPITAAYDPALLTQIIQMVGIKDTVTYRFPDGTTWAQYAFLKDIAFAPLVDGTHPECTINVVPTNWDPTNRVEAGPTITSVGGT